MAASGIDRIALLANIGEAVVELVRESGLLKKKPGRRKGQKKRKYTRRKPVDGVTPEAPKIKVKRKLKALAQEKPKPAPEPEQDDDDEEEDD